MTPLSFFEDIPSLSQHHGDSLYGSAANLDPGTEKPFQRTQIQKKN
jgi:hypothetical protein